MKFVGALLIFGLLASVPMSAQDKARKQAPESAATASSFKPVLEYDPKRDAAKDIKDALAEATRTDRNVLVEVGGKWCVWCGYLDKFFDQNATLRNFRDANYVMVKVNWSPENKNEKLLSQYPKVEGYPHMFVLDKSGKLLHSQDTSKLEEGRGYGLKAVATFLQDWAPKR